MSASLAIVPLGELVKPTRPRVKPTEFPELPFIGMEHVEAHSMRLLGTVPAKTMKSSAVRFKPGDVLYGRLRPYLNKVYRPSFEGLCSAEFIVLPENDRVDGAYLQYILNSGAFVRYATHLNAGDRPRVDFDQLAAYRIPLPGIDDQRRVVAEIEKQFSRLDEVIANLKRVSTSLKGYKGAILTEATCIDQKTLPTDWRWSTVGELAEVGTGATPKRDRAEYWRNGTVPWVASAVVNKSVVTEPTELITERALRETNCGLYPPGTLLVAMYGEGKTRGMCAELGIAAATNQALAAIQAPAGIQPYLKLVLQASYVRTRRAASGGVQPNLNLSHVRAIRVPLPPPEELYRIVEDVARRLSIADDLISHVRAHLSRAERLRQTLLANALQAKQPRDERSTF